MELVHRLERQKSSLRGLLGHQSRFQMSEAISQALYLGVSIKYSKIRIK
jgi:hypothetical protein